MVAQHDVEGAGEVVGQRAARALVHQGQEEGEEQQREEQQLQRESHAAHASFTSKALISGPAFPPGPQRDRADGKTEGGRGVKQGANPKEFSETSQKTPAERDVTQVSETRSVPRSLEIKFVLVDRSS
ncbi:hypothetical protein C0J50_1571 [Silurus asotus]|uniref:Uncharacterized protein n=1 Tax=Silurus asotus TaxID=30991 RepID=A0AAD5A715_SILAS|nr:hypothetical protein C0J50_1571 [Silurus asotus]